VRENKYTAPILLFIIGFVYYFHFKFVGTLRGGECILLILFLLFPFSVRVFGNNKYNLYFFSLIIFNVFLILLSNYFNHASITASLKGISNTVFILICTLSMYLLLNKNALNIRFLFIGLFIGSFFSSPYLLDFSKGGIEEQYFDIVIVPTLMPILLLTSTFHLKNRFIFFIISISIGTMAVFFNARSTGLVLVLSSIIYGISILSQKRLSKILYLFSIIIFLVLVASTYTFFARSGKLGKMAESQIDQKITFLSIFQMIGRPDPLIALVAIKDKPWLGHGSDSDGLRYIKKTIGVKFLPKEFGGYFGNEKIKIPSHSVILGAAVESGIFSAMVWVFIFSFFVGALMNIQYIKADPLFYFVVFSCFSAFWNLLFSPFGFARFDLPYLWSGTLIVLSKYKNILQR